MGTIPLLVKTTRWNTVQHYIISDTSILNQT